MTDSQVISVIICPQTIHSILQEEVRSYSVLQAHYSLEVIVRNMNHSLNIIEVFVQNHAIYRKHFLVILTRGSEWSDVDADGAIFTLVEEHVVAEVLVV